MELNSTSPPSLMRPHLWPTADKVAMAQRASATATGAPDPPALADFIAPTISFELEAWQQFVCRRLQLLPHQTGQRILMHGPPQFGKSIIVSQRFPAWSLGVNPLSRIRLACYNLTHAERFSKVNLSIMRSPEFTRAFPHVRVPDKVPADEWSTLQRASLLDANPSFKALGLASGFVGMGVDTLIIDDPYKNREEARSPVINASIWGWWTDVVMPRLNPDTNVVVMFHRWVEDDFAGRLQEQGGWEYLRFAAIADGDDDPMGREMGEPLSARYPVDYLEKIQAENPQTFLALYQGTPKAREGNMFKLHQLPIVPALPAGDDIRRIRYWDLGGSDSSKADYSVGVLMSRTPDGLFYVEDVARGQWSPRERNEHIRATAEADQLRGGVHGDGRSRQPVTTWIEKVPGLAVEVIDNIVRLMAGLAVKTEMARNDKVTRADPFADQCEAGNVRVVAGAWNKAYRDELTAFPNGKNDDQVDASSGAFSKLNEPDADRTLHIFKRR